MSVFNENPVICGSLMQYSTDDKLIRNEDYSFGSTDFFRIVADCTYDWEYWEAPTGEFIYVSPSCERITGYRAEEFVADHELLLRIIHPEDRPAVKKHLEDRTRRCVEHLEFRVIARDGNTVWVEHACQELFSQKGHFMGRRASNRDITKRKQTDEALRLSEERLRLAIEAGQLGTYDIDLINETVTAPPMTERLFGFANSDTTHAFYEGIYTSYRLNEYLSRIHRDDIADIKKAIKDSVEKGEYVLEYRVVHPDGAIRWLHSRGVIIHEESGRPLRLHGVLLDITARREMEEALRLSNVRKNEFLAVLSHELRNPLSPIKNSLYILRHAEPGGPAANRAQTIIERQVNQLVRLVDDLLDIARINGNKIRVRKTEVELTELIKHVIEDNGPFFSEKQLTISQGFVNEPVFISADKDRLAQIAGNLLQNAVKFTPKGGKITISVFTDSSDAVLRICDTGVGMSADTIENLFQPFMQAKKSLDRSNGGMGLGLALVKALVDIHGGEVKAGSAGLYKGSDFEVRLPLHERMARAIPPF